MAVVILTYLLIYYAAALTLILLFMGYVSIMASTTIVWMDLGVGQTFAKVFSKFAVRSRKAESRTKVAVSSWWVGTFIRPRSGRRDF